MKLEDLSAISPVDGRYRGKVVDLAEYFSEFGLIKYRVRIEIEYFIALCRYKIPQLANVEKFVFEQLRDVYKNFSIEDAAEVKDIEKTTNHDVKAVEYFIKKHFDRLGLQDYKEFVHFGLTSQDINNTAVPLSYKEALKSVYSPLIDDTINDLISISEEWKDIPLLARTHGQPASPTRLGKEISVFVERLKTQLGQFKQIPISAKFGGATGNFNAHHVAYPQIDWAEFGNAFVNHVLGLDRLQTTTQIEHYDNLAASFHNLSRINTILLDFCKDIWTYVSMDYFKQKIKAGEVGSSAMPHKVNPIDFENAEGNLGIANALFEHMASKLPVSRLQRDLTDSTVLRNIGVPLAHTLIALKSISKGVSKLLLNQDKIEKDLENNWLVVSEAIQTILRREAYPNPYEALRDLTRTNAKIGNKEMADFVEGLDVSESVKEEIKQITPFNYTGI